MQITQLQQVIDAGVASAGKGRPLGAVKRKKVVLEVHGETLAIASQTVKHLLVSRRTRPGEHTAMDINELRRLNLIALIRQQFNDSAAEFARKIERSDSQVSQLVKGTRRLGEKQARHIERRLALATGALDRHETADATTARQTAPPYATLDPASIQLLRSFGRLTHKQQSSFIAEIDAAAKANEIIIREIGPRLCPPDDETVARHLPPAPGTKK